MADPLSISAAIAGFIPLAVEALKYFQDVKQEPRERQMIIDGFTELEATLRSLVDRAKSIEDIKRAVSIGPFGQTQHYGNLFQRYEIATQPKGRVASLRGELEDILGDQKKQRVSKWVRFSERVFWTLKKGELQTQLDHVLKQARLLRDYLHDDDVQISQATFVGVTEVRRGQIEAEVLEILDWICPSHDTLQMLASDAYSVSRDADRFLSSELYKEWVQDAEESHWRLSCFGKPGSGKVSTLHSGHLGLAF